MKSKTLTKSDNNSQDGRKSLMKKVLEIESIDPRRRKIDISVTNWINQMDDDLSEFGGVQVFNWLAGVRIEHCPGNSLILYTPIIVGSGSGASEKTNQLVFAKWLERMFPYLLRAEKASRIEIYGLRDWRYPEDDDKSKTRGATEVL